VVLVELLLLLLALVFLLSCGLELGFGSSYIFKFFTIFSTNFTSCINVCQVY
jgi:hypothetical protein